jgi:hypothetical protein
MAFKQAIFKQFGCLMDFLYNCLHRAHALAILAVGGASGVSQDAGHVGNSALAVEAVGGSLDRAGFAFAFEERHLWTIKTTAIIESAFL